MQCIGSETCRPRRTEAEGVIGNWAEIMQDDTACQLQAYALGYGLNRSEATIHNSVGGTQSLKAKVPSKYSTFAYF